MIVPGRLLTEAGAVVVERLEVADTFLSRFRGLQLRQELPTGRGMLLVPCSSVHTFWMRVVIDVIFLDARGKVLKVKQGLRPWRVTIPVWRAHAVLEVPTGGAVISVGERIRLEHSGSKVVRRSLRFLMDEGAASTTPAGDARGE